MRVVGGRLKGKPLKAPAGDGTRPTSDRLRESLFNILAHGRMGDAVEDARVIDLFAGSGALGIEALSRGARFCLFIEEDAGARGAIRENCSALGLNGTTKIFRRDAAAMGPLERFEPFTLAFLDPPYGKGLGERALASLSEGGWLADDALCVLEERADIEIAAPDGFELLDTRAQGQGAVTFLRWTGTS
ncbi:MAG: 16S rRNA (guanine(966)-N(2))-methyltransferase RsmD [Pseudomonadota bacterium]